ncbi:alpha/beta fold hydrolase [Rahnella victoriana]|jgi:3-oxoadipate enol-lactonase|uniref:alpha/beta fold hydrolase n=1 Tax=Rahnella victoriana TaxID=1510570 RepID=UPI00103E7897|nr:alpha/beta fold hydrolase [Rahnella victoriana]TBX34215.1 alpha/beta fold hydrolase [Rahnella victoriana]UHM92362.1 alpha/beta fold hydrolase [Rahnella victoriana]
MFVKCNDLIMHVDLQGPTDAPVLVLLHSLGTNFHIWDAQVPALTRHYRVLRLDMRGHGLSETGQAPFSLEDLADDVLRIADYFDISTFSVAGVSIGGLIAQHIADTAPQRLRSMVLIDTYLAPASSSFWRTMADNIRQNGLDSLAPEIFGRWVTAEFRDTPAALGMKQMLNRTSDEGYAKCADVLSQIEPKQPRNTQVPLRVLVGEHDMVATPAAAQEMATARHGELVVLRNAAHIPLFEKSGEILGEMLCFLAKDFSHDVREKISV